jgi:hypothetical protein
MTQKNSLIRRLVLVVALLLLTVLYFFGHNIGIQAEILREGLTQTFQIVRDLCTVAALAAVSGGIGRTLLARFSLDALHPAERITLESAFGLGVISIGALIMGLLGWFNGLMWAMLALAGVLTIRNLIRWVADMRRVLQGALRPQSTWGRFLMLSVTVLLGSSLLMALAPPTAWDSLTYQMEVPHYYLDAGQIIANPTNHYFGLPQHLNVLFGLAMSLFGSETTAAPLHWYTGFLGTLAVGGILRRHTDKPTAYLSAFIFLSGYSIWRLFGQSYVDLAMWLYGACAMIALVQWSRTVSTSEISSSHWLMLAAAFCGFGLSTKYTAGVFLVAVGVFVLVRQPRRVIQNGLLISGIVLLCYAPWGVRAFLLYDNPIYPYGYEVFGGLNWDAVRARSFSGGGLITTQYAWMLPILPFAATIFGIESRAPFIFATGPFLLTLPFLLLLTWQTLPPKARSLAEDTALLGGFMLISWIGFATFAWIAVQPRLMLMGFPPAAVCGALAVYGLSQWEHRPLNIWFITRVVLVVVFLLGSFEYLFTWSRVQVTDYLGNAISRDTYLERNLPLNYPAMQHLETLPESSTVRFLWEPRYYHCPDTIVCMGDVALDFWAYPIRTGTSPDDLMQQWRDGDTDYILLADQKENPQGLGYTFWRDRTGGRLYDILSEFPYYLERYMQPIWTDGTVFTLYEWRDTPLPPSDDTDDLSTGSQTDTQTEE